MTKVKSVLRYAGGKTRAVKILLPLIPESVPICSPFVGGGSVEFALASRGQKVFCYDNYLPLVNFWSNAKEQPKELADMVLRLSNGLNIDKELFKQYQKDICNSTGVAEAAKFYIVNRCSFSGTTASGGMSINHPRFNKPSIDRLKKFNANDFDIAFDNLGFLESIAKHENDFLFLDPPYDINCFIYGNKGDQHKGFNHKGLHEALKNRGNWLMTYNDNKFIRELYKDCDIKKVSWAYGMNASKAASEIIITPK